MRQRDIVIIFNFCQTKFWLNHTLRSAIILGSVGGYYRNSSSSIGSGEGRDGFIIVFSDAPSEVDNEGVESLCKIFANCNKPCLVESLVKGPRGLALLIRRDIR